MNLRPLAALLRRKVPAKHAVKLRRRSLRDELAYCKIVVTEGAEPYFLIVLSSDVRNQELAEHLLMHEWAHALCYVGENHNSDHSAAWGVAYAQVWNAARGD